MTEKQPSTILWTTVRMVAAWYGSNIGVLLLNKYLLTNYGFKFPIFLTLCHMAACTVLSYTAIVLMEVVPLQRVKSKVQLAKISGLSVVFCFCVVCGNVSLKYLPVSFNESVGATTTFFTAVFAFSIIKKREALLTYTALIPVVAGVIIASGGKTQLDEPAVVPGTDSSNIVTSRNPVDGEKRDRNHNGTCSERYRTHLVPHLRFFSSIFCELDQFLGHQAYKRFDPFRCWGMQKGQLLWWFHFLVFKNPVSSMGMVGYALTVLGVLLYSEAKKRYS